MKGVAIPYIIAILLGISVVALVGYLFFASGQKFGGSVLTPGCQEIKERYCQEWKASEFSVEPIITKWKSECDPKPNIKDCS